MNARVTCTHCEHESKDIEEGLEHIATEHGQEPLW